MKAVVAAFNQEKALVGTFSVIKNLRMELFKALDFIFSIQTDTSKQSSQTTGQRKSEHVLRLAARIRSNETSSSIYIPEFRFWHEAGTINTFLLHFSIFIRYFSAGPDLHSE